MDIDQQMFSSGNPVTEDVFEDLTNVEQRFYQEGFDSGLAHGKLHGLFEGRELGREKGFELWEEVGFVKGFTEFWLEILSSRSDSDVLASKKGKEARALNHAKLLLELIEGFPTSNPNPGEPVAEQMSADDLAMDEDAPVVPPVTKEGEVDLPALLSSIRARYKLLCASLGVRPRLTATSTKSGQTDASSAGGVVVEGVEGPMKGVDTRQLRF